MIDLEAKCEKIQEQIREGPAQEIQWTTMQSGFPHGLQPRPQKSCALAPWGLELAYQFLKAMLAELCKFCCCCEGFEDEPRKSVPRTHLAKYGDTAPV